MEIVSSPLPTLAIDVGDAQLQRDPSQRLAPMSLASQAAVALNLPAAAPSDTVSSTLISTLTTLATRQDSLGQLLADLTRPGTLARVPAEVRADVVRVLTLARPVVLAGLTRPEPAPASPQATQPQAAPAPAFPGTSPSLPADARLASLAPLAAALEDLQTSLKAWQPGPSPSSPTAPPQPAAAAQATPATVAPAAPQGATAATFLQTPPTTAPLPPTLPQAAQAAPLRAPPLPTAETTPTPSTAAGMPAAPVMTPPVSGTPATAVRPGGIADALASLLLAQQSGATPEEALQRLRTLRQALPHAAADTPTANVAHNAVSAYRKAMPAAPVAPATPWPADPDNALVARTLMQRTEAALTQTRLLDVAGQLQKAEQAPTQGPANTPGHWNFELPLGTPFGQSRVRFEIDRQARRQGDGKPSVIWRARLSLDVEPLGPVHAHIALHGTKTWVGLWAERPETAALLAENRTILRQSLGFEDLEAELSFHGGAPVTASDGTGTIWDASA